MTVIWGVVGMGVGVWIAAQLIWPALNFNTAWLSYGRLRPLHTNAVIFAFGLGTLPAMTGTALLAGQVNRLRLRRHPAFRRLAGALLIAFGVWTAVLPPPLVPVG